ncbi:class I SAM-dependent methyltransferase [Nakamurella flava]|uniref:Class I SAM-dependent methyltransferase n=1 Tax=Nakamurella flava TaxID=2576308 RepID=A0A4U6QEA1_9ACTN|nr:class I SAM-dependent methyltransferase [Nakamurella flava]TKV58463.1 class I SAM-dependent methyltransferase [Nakamurella flava]
MSATPDGPTGAGHGAAAGWSAADVEPVVCCLCGEPGAPLYEQAPFAVVRCPRCALVFVSPRLTAEALQRLYDEPAYFDDTVYGTSRWSPAMLLQRTWTAGRLALLAAQVPPPARLLEIGSGYGHFLAAARDAGYQARGIELSRTGVAHARDRLGLDVFAGQLADDPNPEPADVVCFWDTLEHVPDPLAFLTQVRQRMSGPDALAALSVPSFASLPARALRSRWWTLKPEQHIWHFTPDTLRVLAARAGLVITRVVTSPVAPGNAGRLDSLVALARPLPDDPAPGGEAR